MELAEKVLKTLETKESHFTALIPKTAWGSLRRSRPLQRRSTEPDSVSYSPAAKKAIAKITGHGIWLSLPVCMAKTQYSLSDDQTKLGRPEGFELTMSATYM